MMSWEIIPAAQEELQSAFSHYDVIDARLADSFYAKYLVSRDRARTTPEIYRVRRHEIRRINLGPQFEEWYIAFLLWNGKFVVLAITHAKRRPFYFSERVAVAKKLF